MKRKILYGLSVGIIVSFIGMVVGTVMGGGGYEATANVGFIIVG